MTTPDWQQLERQLLLTASTGEDDPVSVPVCAAREAVACGWAIFHRLRLGTCQPIGPGQVAHTWDAHLQPPDGCSDQVNQLAAYLPLWTPYETVLDVRVDVPAATVLAVVCLLWDEGAGRCKWRCANHGLLPLAEDHPYLAHFVPPEHLPPDMLGGEDDPDLKEDA